MGAELMTVATVLAIPVSIAFVFPYTAMDFHATAWTTERRPAVSFVRLTAEEEARALRAAKTSWQNSDGVRNQQADIFFPELPEERFSSVMTVKERRRESELPIVERGQVPFLPSRRAAPPARIPSDAGRVEPLTFSREELLKID